MITAALDEALGQGGEAGLHPAWVGDDSLRAQGAADIHDDRVLRCLQQLVGPITVDYDVLTAPDTELYVIVFTAEPGSEDASRLDLLRVTGTQPLARAD